MVAYVSAKQDGVYRVDAALNATILQNICLINNLSVKETVQILNLAISKSWWNPFPNLKNEDLVLMDFHGCKIFVRKETV